MKDKIVVFDLDGTLIKYSSERLFIRFLIEKGIVTVKDLPNALSGFWLVFKGGWSGILQRNKYYLKGKGVQTIEELAKEFFSEKADKIVSEKSKLILSQYKSDETKLFLISGAPYFILDIFGNNLGFDDWKGTDLVKKGGTFTGEIDGIHPFGTDKIKALSYLIKKNSLANFQAVAYANHFKDRYLLEKVDHPIAVNPDRKLKRHAKRKGWEVIYL